MGTCRHARRSLPNSPCLMVQGERQKRARGGKQHWRSYYGVLNVSRVDLKL
jgi:hypothetical protein